MQATFLDAKNRAISIGAKVRYEGREWKVDGLIVRPKAKRVRIALGDNYRDVLPNSIEVVS